MIYTVLQQLAQTSSMRVFALAMNEGVLVNKLRGAGLRVVVIPEAEHTIAGIVRLAYRHLRGESIHIIHTHRYKENLIGWILGKALNVPCCITTLHGMPECPTTSQRGDWRESVANAIDRAVLRWGFRRIVAVSRDIAKLLTQTKRCDASQLCVIHNGIAMPPPMIGPGRFGSSGETEVFRIGTVCRLVPVKGLDLFLEIAKDVTRRSSHMHFSILGDGPLRSYLEEKIECLGLQERVDLLEPREDPISFYRSLDLYLNTSIHEGIPCSVLEAMGCAVPIIAPWVGGIPEIVTHGETGLLMADRKPEAFADAIRTLERDRELRRTMGLNARGVIESRFSETIVGNSYAALYRSLVAV